MSAKNLPIDGNSRPIPTLAYDTNSVVKISVATASANVALASTTNPGDIIRVASTVDCYVTFGTSGSVTADSSDTLFTAGVEVMTVPKGATHIAAIRVDTDGVLTVTELV